MMGNCTTNSMPVEPRRRKFVPEAMLSCWVRPISCAARIVIGERRRGLFRNESDGGNGANVVAADVAFPAHIKAAERRDFLAAVAGGVRGTEVEPKNIAVLIDGVEILRIDNVGNGFHVAAQSGKSHRIIKTFAARGV